MSRIHISPALRAFIAVLLVAGTTAGGAHYTYDRKINALEQQLAQERAAAAKQIEETQHLIDALTALSDQAMITQWRMRDLELLERKLRRLTGTGSIFASIPEPADVSQGGMLHIPEPRQIPESAEQVKHEYDELLESVEYITVRYKDMVETFEAMEDNLRNTPILWPTESRQITSGFGLRKDPFTRRSAQHNGVDIDGESGDPVYATADGVVLKAGWNPYHGNHIMIEHQNEFVTVYSHLSKLLATEGTFVARGEQIGEIGSTGRSTGPHLHYEIHRNGQAVNPEDYMLAE